LYDSPELPGRAAADLIPAWRGLLHAYTFWIALAAATTLVIAASTPRARVAAGIYGAGLCTLFAVSGLYHRWRWDARWRPLLRRLDHSTIFVFIAASTTPLALLILSGRLQALVLVIVWLGALAGVIASVTWIDAPRALVASSYVAVGCAALAGLPQIADRGRCGDGPLRRDRRLRPPRDHDVGGKHARSRYRPTAPLVIHLGPARAQTIELHGQPVSYVQAGRRSIRRRRCSSNAGASVVG
jgi:channel protein (hemolysin III family)